MQPRSLGFFILLLGCELETKSLGEAPLAGDGSEESETSSAYTSTGGTLFTTTFVTSGTTLVTSGEGEAPSAVVARVCSAKCQQAAFCSGSASPRGCTDQCIAEMPLLPAECEEALDAYYECIDPGRCADGLTCAAEADRVIGLCSSTLCDDSASGEVGEVGGPNGEETTFGESSASCEYSRICRGNMYTFGCEGGECTCFLNREAIGSCPQGPQCSVSGWPGFMPFSDEVRACCPWSVATLLPG